MIKTLLVYDVPGWACESECKALAKHLALAAPGVFDVTLSPANLTPDRLKAFDLVFSTIYYHLEEANHPKSVSQVSSYSYWIRKSWPDGWPHLKQWQFMIAKNTHIASILTADDHPRIRQLYHPFDHDHWRPAEGRTPNDVFTVGFAGHRQGLKGLELIEEAVRQLGNVKLLSPTWENGRIPFSEMPAFYNSLDAYVCMSLVGQDAGPRPPIEAGLCGVPVITTRAGQIGEMIEDGENGLIVERNVESLKLAIARLKYDRDLHKRIAMAIRPSFLTEWVMDVGRAWTHYFYEVMNTK